MEHETRKCPQSVLAAFVTIFFVPHSCPTKSNRAKSLCSNAKNALGSSASYRKMGMGKFLVSISLRD